MEEEKREHGLMMSDHNQSILEKCDGRIYMASFSDDDIDLSSHFVGDSKSHRADTIMKRVDGVSRTGILEEE